jgi:hypothetical protein
MALTPDQQTYTTAVANATADVKAAIASGNQSAYETANSQLQSANSNLASATTAANALAGTQTTTNPSASDSASAATVASATVAGDTSSGSFLDSITQPLSKATNAVLGAFGIRSVNGVPDGAQPLKPGAVTANIKTAGQSVEVAKDLRVRIKVPPKYIQNVTQGLGGELSSSNIGGIIFPYTPSISLENSAEYANSNPTHSNFSVYFYKNSKVSPISISGKFTVQNEQDAGVYLATVHLLRSLTKMRSGGSTGDMDSGAPPPICRLFAYGDFMFDNTPVVISSFRLELPDGVDYYKLGKIQGSPAYSLYGVNSVPTVSSISITCIPIYSRQEMQQFSVDGWLSNNSNRKAGYL